MVRGPGVESDRPRRRCHDVKDYGPRPEDDPARKTRDASGARGPTDEAYPAAGRWAASERKKDPAIEGTLRELVQERTGGDPMSQKKWVRASLRQLSRELGQGGHTVSAPTVGRLLRKLGFGLRANLKSEETGSNHPDRDTQFGYIAERRAAFVAAGEPVISVDTKKKDLIGNLENAGRAWGTEAERVNVYDFPSEAEGRAVPYGIYDVAKNRGWVMVGQSADTAEFAVEAIASWWEEEGRESYPSAKRLLILADGGGSNGARSRVWKQQVQERLA